MQESKRSSSPSDHGPSSVTVYMDRGLDFRINDDLRVDMLGGRLRGIMASAELSVMKVAILPMERREE